MITVITGLPGSCKTLYTVDKLLPNILKMDITFTDAEGVERTAPRKVYTNINGLLLEHEKIDQGAAWNYDSKSEVWRQGEGLQVGLNNWHQWVKPGDVIVFDEVQKPWPLSATGSKVPPCIEALETHRHMGVDFILMTQHPMMIHANLTRLAGRHLHMRRLGNMGLATVYEWDGVSRSLLYKNTMAKYPYRYGKKAFANYKSAEVHTKQPRKLPSLIWGALLALAGMAYIGPTVASRLSERINPTPKSEQAALAKTPTMAITPTQALTVPKQTPTPLQSTIDPVLTVSGCAANEKRCTCYDQSGAIVPVPETFCRAGSVTAGLVTLSEKAAER